MIRVRFAPSPTGNLHIGTLRTALFSWVFAKSNQGAFILRIEDTDFQRSELKYENNIREGLEWFNLDCDESPEMGGAFGPYRQSDRIKEGIYLQYALNLVETNHAYYCFCEKEDINNCSQLSKADVKQQLASDKPYTIRFKMPSEDIKVSDLIRGDITFDSSLIHDFVMIKSDGSPSYNFACVIDDGLMKISHVIRGEDHISNTPRQLSIYDALSWTRPSFAHMPMILGPDKAKLSKRHGATSILDYKSQGYLPEAMFNYLMLLGWTPKDDKEIVTREEVLSEFSLESLSKSNAVFDIQKLQWMNGQYIRTLSDESFYDLVQPFVSADQRTLLKHYSDTSIRKIFQLISVKMNDLTQVNDHLKTFTKSDVMFESELSGLTKEQRDVLQLFKKKIEAIQSISAEDIQTYMNEIVSELSLGKGNVFKPIRVFTTGDSSGPDIGQILEVYGKERVLNRLDIALKHDTHLA